MEYYKLKQDVESWTVRPEGSNIAQQKVSFKKGDFVQGEIGGDPTIDTGFLIVKTPKGTVHFTLGRNSVLEDDILKGNRGAAYQPNSNNKQNDTTSSTTSNDKKKISTGAIVGIVFGVLALGTIVVLVVKK
jgi:hypothetical protein